MFTCQPCRVFLKVLFFTLLLNLLPAAQGGQEKPNPILEQVKAKVKNANKPFTMVVLLQVKEGAAAKFEEELSPAIKATRKEKGCLAYDLNRSLDTPDAYVLYERWKTVADLDAHLKAEYITSLLPKLNDLLAGAPKLQVLLPAGE